MSVNRACCVSTAGRLRAEGCPAKATAWAGSTTAVTQVTLYALRRKHLSHWDACFGILGQERSVTVAKVRSSALTGYVELTQSLGSAPDPFMRAAGIDPT